MDDALLQVSWIVMGGGTAGLGTAALVDRHVDERGAWLHPGQVRPGDETRSLGPGDAHGADDEVGARHGALDVHGVLHQRRDVPLHNVPHVPQPQRVDVDHGDVGPETDADHAGVEADDTGADDRHPSTSDAGDAGSSKPLPPDRISREVAPA